MIQGTRQGILAHLRRQGQATVRDLAHVMRLTPTAIRQHLTVLERDGMVDTSEVRGRVGRPALVYRLSDRAEGLLPNNYFALANLLLEEIRAAEGLDGEMRLLRRVAGRMVSDNAYRVEGLPLGRRVQGVAELLRAQGCEVRVEHGEDGSFLLRECTCPYTRVARAHHEVCALEFDMVRRLLGGEVKLVSSLLRGDDSCSYRVRPLAEAVAAG